MAQRLTSREQLDRSVAESDLQASFVDAARLMGWKHMHVSDSRRMVRKQGQLVMVGDAECKGWPDLFLAHEATGRILIVEVKRETERLSDEQKVWFRVLEACGLTTFVLRPSNYDEGLALLRRRQPAASGRAAAA